MTTALTRIDPTGVGKPNVQKRRITLYIKKSRLTIHRWDEQEIGQDKDIQQLNEEILSALRPNDRIVIPSLSILGKNLLMVCQALDNFFQKGVVVYSAKEELIIKKDSNSKKIIAALKTAAGVEKEIIDQRIKKGMAKKRQSGKPLGRPKGSLSQKTKLSGKEERVRRYLKKKVAISAIARIFEVHRHTMREFIGRSPALRTASSQV